MDFAFFDSGTGGIPYMLYLKKLKQDAKCSYLADVANFPYGEKTSSEIVQCSSSVISKIVDVWKPDTIVIACNTISVSSLDMQRKILSRIPIVGTVPAIKVAASVTKNKNIGLLATNATIHDSYVNRLKDDFAFDCNLFSFAAPELVSFIEYKLFSATEKEIVDCISPSVDFFTKNNCDTVILGCTHFTHIAQTIQIALGDKVCVVDSRDGVSRHAIEVREQFIKNKKSSLLSDEDELSFFVSKELSYDEEKRYRKICNHFNIKYCGLFN